MRDREHGSGGVLGGSSHVWYIQNRFTRPGMLNPSDKRIVQIGPSMIREGGTMFPRKARMSTPLPFHLCTSCAASHKFVEIPESMPRSKKALILGLQLFPCRRRCQGNHSSVDVESQDPAPQGVHAHGLAPRTCPQTYLMARWTVATLTVRPCHVCARSRRRSRRAAAGPASRWICSVN